MRHHLPSSFALRLALALLWSSPLLHAQTTAVAPAPAASAASTEGVPRDVSGALPTVRARARAEPGTHTVDVNTLRVTPSANNDMLSVLRMAPSLRLSNTQNDALTQGELAPPQISIHGAKPYQNLFLLDGLSVNNDLDTVSSRVATSVTDVPGNPLGMPIDKELICELQLLDSNVSAEHGGFQGGVVKAELCDARHPLAGRVTLKLSRSAWQTIYVDPAEEAALEQSSAADKQARWDKQFWTAQLEGKPTAQLGIVAQASYARSIIPLRGYVAAQTPNDSTLAEKEQRRTQRDGSVKLTWRPHADTSAWVSLREQPLADRYFIVNSRNSNFEVQGGGRAVTAGAQHLLAGWRLRHDLSRTDVRQSRRSDADFLRVWSWSAADKNWGDGTRGTTSLSTEGSWGHIDTEQHTAGYKLKLSHDAPLMWLGVEHDISGGLDLVRRDAFYARPNDQMSYTANHRVATATCTSPLGVVDAENCSLAPSLRYPNSGQYFRARNVYRAGRFDVQADQYGLWLQDAMRWGGLTVRAGLRADRDELARQAVLAPRLSTTWALGASGNTELEAGLNRYHGRSLFGMAIREKIDTLQITQERRATDWAWVQTQQSLLTNRLKDLAVPYDDETKLGITQRFDAGWRASVSWVHRQARDQITRVRERDTSGSGQYANNQFYVYTNNGRGSTDTVALELTPRRPFAALAGSHRWRVWAGRSQTRSNHVSYETSLSDADADRLIVYKGQVMPFSDRPAENFNAPWTAYASLQSDWGGARLSLFQSLRWQGGYRRVAETSKTEVHDGATLRVHEETAFPITLSWDASLRWEPRWSTQRPFVQLSVSNVSNRRNVIDVGAAGTVSYETGRAATLEMGYAF